MPDEDYIMPDSPAQATRFDLPLLLKFLAGFVLMAMLFALTVLGKVPAESFETLAVGVLGALGGHAAGNFGKEP
jgi:glycerol uptake facilitator-like aquaporin